MNQCMREDLGRYGMGQVCPEWLMFYLGYQVNHSCHNTVTIVSALFFGVFYIFKGLVFSIIKYDPKNKNCKVFLKHKFFLEVTIVYYSCFMSTHVFFWKFIICRTKKFCLWHIIFMLYLLIISLKFSPCDYCSIE